MLRGRGGVFQCYALGVGKQEDRIGKGDMRQSRNNRS